MRSDAPPCVAYLHTNQLLSVSVEGESGRSHLFGTASGSDLLSHAILLGQLIVIRFYHKIFYIWLGMLRYVLLRKHLGTILLIVLVPNVTASSWNRSRRGYLWPTKICHLWRPAKPYPIVSFGDRRLLLLYLLSNGNRNYQLAPWSTPSGFSKYYLNSDGEYQGVKNPVAGHRRGLHYWVKNIPSDTCPQQCLVLKQNVQGLKGREKL